VFELRKLLAKVKRGGGGGRWSAIFTKTAMMIKMQQCGAAAFTSILVLWDQFRQYFEELMVIRRRWKHLLMSFLQSTSSPD